MRLGSLGEQLMLKSQKSFETLIYIRSEPADGEIYFSKRNYRDKQAREQYLKKERKQARQRDDIFILDVLRGDETRRCALTKKLILAMPPNVLEVCLIMQ
jgi:hypothetical protein